MNWRKITVDGKKYRWKCTRNTILIREELMSKPFVKLGKTVAVVDLYREVPGYHAMDCNLQVKPSNIEFIIKKNVALDGVR